METNQSTNGLSKQQISDAENSNISLIDVAKNELKKSPFANCTREAFLWGIATGTAMGLHRYRMGSRLKTVSNFTFGTILLVAAPSYYMCSKTKIWNKKAIEEMMAANDFEHQSNAPLQPTLDDHPFLRKLETGEVCSNHRTLLQVGCFRFFEPD